MSEPITISASPPPLDSMNYDLLREKGLTHLQRLSGKIWTDYNAHDPGITMLEVLSYAITDLGYRTNFDIRDLLAAPPAVNDIKNFFTAAQIMPNAPVTIRDYRKLLMDVTTDVQVTPTVSTVVGIRNAWLLKARNCEQVWYANIATETLTYDQPAPNADRMLPMALYDVLLEFDENEVLGDLNANTISKVITLPASLNIAPPSSPAQVVNAGVLQGMTISIEAEFPRWDTPGVDWSSVASIRSHMGSARMSFSRVPSPYDVSFVGLNPAGDVLLSVTDTSNPTNPVSPATISAVADMLEFYLYDSITPSSMLFEYQRKIAAIHKLTAEAHRRLMANRNLCEDFLAIRAFKVEEIALCADVDIETGADVETVQAQIFYEIAQFISPTLYFHSLAEMYERGYTTDQIFEGPLLSSGFIDNAELDKAELRKVLRASDLINIIMDVPGVVAVRNLQMANIPLDNDDQIPQQIVRWCLELAFDRFYVPRLSVPSSQFTFYKNQLPYRGRLEEVQQLLDNLNATDRPRRLWNTPLDIPVPQGTWTNAGEYATIQNEFPRMYGIGEAGLPGNVSDVRKLQAKQLKEYLLFFDQLLANYLAQVANLWQFFSHDNSRSPSGDFTINKTLYSQSLINLVPNAAELYFDGGTLTGQAQHAIDLQRFTESRTQFEERRNRVADHLMARFAESFNDYALLMYRIDGARAADELIEDKFDFINAYPQLSSGRFKAFNYAESNLYYNAANAAGFEQRTSLLAGIDEWAPEELYFSSDYKIIGNTISGFSVEIFNGITLLMASPASINTATRNEAVLRMEKLITSAIVLANYQLVDASTLIVTDSDHYNPAGTYRIGVCEGEQVLALIDTAVVLPVPGAGFTAGTYAYAMEQIRLLFVNTLFAHISSEYMNNVGANRRNFAIDFDRYFNVTAITPVLNPPDGCGSQWTIDYTLSDGNGNTVMSGTVPFLKLDINDNPGTTLAPNFNLVNRTFFWLLRVAKNPLNYRYDQADEGVALYDTCGVKVGTVVNTDILSSYLAAIQSRLKFSISDSLHNDGNYLMLQASDAVRVTTLPGSDSRLFTIAAPLTTVPANPALNTTYVDGIFESAFSFAVTAISLTENYVELTGADSLLFGAGDKFVITAPVAFPSPNTGNYTVQRVVRLNAANCRVYLNELLASATLTSGLAGELYFTAPIVGFDSVLNAVVVEMPQWTKVIDRMTAEVQGNFFAHEGMHLVEHILVRPKNRYTLTESLSGNGLQQPPTNAAFGKIAVCTDLVVTTADQALRKFTVAGNYQSVLGVNSRIRITGSAVNDAFYTVSAVAVNGGNTEITVNESLANVVPLGTLQFWITRTITGLNDSNAPTPNVMKFSGAGLPSTITLTGEAVVELSMPLSNNGRYTIATSHTQTLAGNFEIQFLNRIKTVRDAFLDINTTADCDDCKYTDPYSYVASVILPVWQGRFSNIAFRNYFERLLRTEAPAHVMLNICWVGYEDMAMFESAWKWWLRVINSPIATTAEKTNAQIGLVTTLKKIRSGYPSGTLHDCDTDDTLQNSIILNNSNIGTL
ncbi:MAG: hypothetical protein MUC87_05145 [Bacteroidia bacterium]|jgi:hypothetical protein|nr:hypothetical protein [Bacteroidia bacterium]